MDLEQVKAARRRESLANEKMGNRFMDLRNTSRIVEAVKQSGDKVGQQIAKTDMAANIISQAVNEVTTKITELVSQLEKQKPSDDANTVQAIAELKAVAAGIPAAIKIPAPPKIDQIKVSNQIDYSPQFEQLIAAFQAIDVNPAVKVEAPKVDLSGIRTAIDKLGNNLKLEIPETQVNVDLKPVIDGLANVANTVSNLKFPIPNYVLPYLNSNGKASQVQLDSSGNIPVSIGSANVTLVASDIEIGAVELKNGTDDTRATVTGANALKVDNSAVNQPISGAGSNAQIKDDSFYGEGVTSGLFMVHPRVWNGASYDRLKGDTTNGMFVNVKAMPATVAQDSTISTTNTEIGGLTEAAPATDTASSGLNGRLQRISQRLTSLIALLPGSLGQKAMTASLAVTIASDQTSIPVTDAAGSLTVDAPVGTPVFVKLSDGAASLVGQKAMAASLPVVLASDQASVPVAATLNAETTKAIGVVRNSDGAGNLLTTNSTTPTAKFSLDQNITSILGTAPTSVGKLDVKAADGDVFVRQATAANLNVTATPIAITKATQGATGFTTQDLKDAGRTTVMVTASVASTATAETLISVNSSKGLAATSAASSNSITTGKRFRIQGIFASVRNSTGTTAGVATIRLRAAVGGATTASSPLQISSSVALPAAATSVNFPTIDVPDGFEIDSNSATNTWGITITHPQWVTGSVVATFDVTLVGYEY